MASRRSLCATGRAMASEGLVSKRPGDVSGTQIVHSSTGTVRDRLACPWTVRGARQGMSETPLETRADNPKRYPKGT